MGDLKKWDNDIYVYDVTEASRLMNPFLKNYGRDRFTHTPEMLNVNTRKIHSLEGPASHGYPYTAWLQLTLVYAIGLYTAKEQGIVKKGVYFQRYWKAHYFDWLLFLKRAGIYGIGGGIVLGTIFFGDKITAQRRIRNRYEFLFTMPRPDPRNTDTQHFPLVNN